MAVNPDSIIEMSMKNGSPYQIQLCVGPDCHCGQSSMKEQITAAVESMSCQSRWRRFASPVTSLTEKQLNYLVNLDGIDRVAWCATIVTDTGERGIGLARYLRLTDEIATAEFALTVVDEYQGQGIGYNLLAKLVETAAGNSIEVLRGYIQGSNRPMLTLCRRFGANMCQEDAFIRADIRVTDSVGNQ